MIRAHDDPLVALALQQWMRPMTAYVVERIQFSARIADDEYALIGDLSGVIVAGLSNIGDVALIPPSLVENRFVLARVDIRVIIPGRWQGEGILRLVPEATDIKLSTFG
jgi:hypothetical protein